ncbi:hypothetical protein H4Q26_001398 [Puccinia striiformis f. sp. tritici PST-130]|nr:hypothetical protein H4Q26_001398 [Puccinia striiformis f. sp. tritici PST-130]
MIDIPINSTMFKQLETNSNLLILAAKVALTRYGPQLVITNGLHSQKNSVLLINLEGEIKLINTTTTEFAELFTGKSGVGQVSLPPRGITQHPLNALPLQAVMHYHFYC